MGDPKLLLGMSGRDLLEFIWNTQLPVLLPEGKKGCSDLRVINEQRVISSDHRSVVRGAWPWGHPIMEGTGVQAWWGGPQSSYLFVVFFSQPSVWNYGKKKEEKWLLGGSCTL